MYYRLVKAQWGQKYLENGKPNPDFVEEIVGPRTYEGMDYTEEFIKEKNLAGYNVYFFPNCPSTPIQGSVSGKHIDTFRFCFVDMDLKEGKYASKEAFYDVLKAFEIKPSMVIDSGNGVHVYWEIEDLDGESYIKLQKRLIAKFDTDKSVWKLAQLLRVPGTFNTKKHKNYVECKEVEDMCSYNVYKKEDLDKVLAPLDHSEDFKIQVHLDKAAGTYNPMQGIELDSEELPEKFKQLMKENSYISNLFNKPKETYNNDRSGADMKLCNLLFSRGFTKKETLQVMLNTEKARSYQGDKMTYAGSMVDKIFSDRPKYAGKTVRELKNDNNFKEVGERLRGPSFLDATKRGWRKRQAIGIIAAEGVGKSTMTLTCFKEMIINNPDKDELYIYFDLENGAETIIEKWEALVGTEGSFYDRLVVISNEDIGPQEIYWAIKETEQAYSKKVACVAVDHIGILSNMVDTTKEPKFNIAANNENGWNDVKPLSEKKLAAVIRKLCSQLDVGLILQSQTTKEKGGDGDIPIRGNAAYGVSHFNWFCDHVFTMWQPLLKVHEEAGLYITAFQYVKIRHTKKEDKVKKYKAKLLAFDPDSGTYRLLTPDEFETFREWNDKANKIRHAEAKKKVTDRSYTQPESEQTVAPVRRFHLVKSDESE